MRGTGAATHTGRKRNASPSPVNKKMGTTPTFTKRVRERNRSDGPDGPPRNNVTATADIVMTFMNSARKKIANLMPVYSVLNPPTSSCSASTRSNGGGVGSAGPAGRENPDRPSARKPDPVAADE